METLTPRYKKLIIGMWKGGDQTSSQHIMWVKKSRILMDLEPSTSQSVTYFSLLLLLFLEKGDSSLGPNKRLVSLSID